MVLLLLLLRICWHGMVLLLLLLLLLGTCWHGMVLLLLLLGTCWQT
jgi:hypothetical protein